MADGLLAYSVSVDQAKALRTILARFTKAPTPEHQQAVRDAVVELAVQLVGAEHLADKIIEWCSQRGPRRSSGTRQAAPRAGDPEPRDQLDLLGGDP